MKTLAAVVAGAGPSGWSLAAMLTDVGAEVVLVSPEPDAIWPQTFGMWTYQWNPQLARVCVQPDPFAVTWKSTVAIGATHHEVGRAYGVLDNERVRRAFSGAAERTGRLRVVSGSVVDVDELDDTALVRLADGTTLHADLVFDGTGARSTLTQRESTQPPQILQRAYGITVRTRSNPFPADSCVLMDWRGPHRGDPSFLYALPFGDGRWLFEETSLAKRGGLGVDELKLRLHARLDDLGVVIDEEEVEETVSFPMDVALPIAGQRVIPIGAAAALVHPATGYSIAASFRTAVALAEVVAGSSGLANPEIAERCWSALWSADRRKARRLESYGLDRLLTMDQFGIRQFFDTFFSLDAKQTQLYLGGEAGAVALSGVMWNVFRKAPLPLRRRLATGNPLLLARSLLR